MNRAPSGAVPAPLGADEAERLAALRAYDVLDTLPEAAYDDIVFLASHIAGTPIGLVSLVETDRQWFKARVGLEAQETSREVSFCAHAILQSDEILVVPDATRDERFAENPLVTGDPGIRFYAGAPLVNPTGHALGTLCVIDRVPHQLTGEQARALAALSREVMVHLELRRLVARLEAALEAASRTVPPVQTDTAEMQRGLESARAAAARSAELLAEAVGPAQNVEEQIRGLLDRMQALQHQPVPRAPGSP